MGLFRVDEVLQIAMQAEEAGRLLYVSLAEQCADQEVAALCRQLAAQEQAHYATFKEMRQSQPAAVNSRRMSLEELDFVQSMIEGKVVPSAAEARATVRDNDLGKVLDLAIAAERGSIEFYLQILPNVDSSNAAEVREIIEEEKRHEESLLAARKRW